MADKDEERKRYEEKLDRDRVRMKDLISPNPSIFSFEAFNIHRSNPTINIHLEGVEHHVRIALEEYFQQSG